MELKKIHEIKPRFPGHSDFVFTPCSSGRLAAWPLVGARSWSSAGCLAASLAGGFVGWRPGGSDRDALQANWCIRSP